MGGYKDYVVPWVPLRMKGFLVCLRVYSVTHYAEARREDEGFRFLAHFGWCWKTDVRDRLSSALHFYSHTNILKGDYPIVYA